MRIIAHIDMDAFFAAIEERENPQFRGLGIVVGADPNYGVGRGVVSTANYQARKYGIYSAMPISTAWRLSEDARMRGEPKTVFLPVNGQYYSQVSHRIFDMIGKHIPVIEQTSVDEAYLDLQIKSEKLKVKSTIQNSKLEDSGIRQAYEDARETVQKIKQEIFQKERLTCKIGIAPNKLVAKITTAKSKPDSVSIILPQQIDSFLKPLAVRDIPGIGPKTEEVLHREKIYTIGDLQKVSKEKLSLLFGKWGEGMYFRARGIDDSSLETERALKSVSEQETFDVDTLSSAILLPKLERLSERVIERMIGEGIEGYRTVTLVVRFSDFTTKNRAHTLKEYASDLGTLKKESLKLFFPFLDKRENPQKKLIRLLGVGIENFEEKDKRVVSQQLEMLS